MAYKLPTIQGRDVRFVLVGRVRAAGPDGAWLEDLQETVKGTGLPARSILLIMRGLSRKNQRVVQVGWHRWVAPEYLREWERQNPFGQTPPWWSPRYVEGLRKKGKTPGEVLGRTGKGVEDWVHPWTVRAKTRETVVGYPH